MERGRLLIRQISLDKYYRLMNTGPTVLVSARAGGRSNVMAAAWAGIVDFAPTPKVSVVLDKATYTRELIEQSGYFGLQVPVVSQVDMVAALGSRSGRNDPDKVARCGAELFYPEKFDVPLVRGCAGWMVCKLISEPHNQQEHDLFIGAVLDAWADDIVFDGHWKFDSAGPQWRTLHHVAGGHFYAIGEEVVARS